jgi:hypothetical protein
MTTEPESSLPENFAEPPKDFSIVLGGPLYQLLCRSRLSDKDLNLLKRRLIAILLLAWLPLLILSIAQGNAWSGVSVPFIKDIGVQIRFLAVMPMLIGAELIVHRRMRILVSHFLDRKLIPEADMARFKAAIESALKLRNSVVSEVLMLVFVYAFGILVIWKSYVGLNIDTWYAGIVDGHRDLNLAGYWLVLVSLPLFQFLIIRWYFRLFIWMRFLWQVSRIKLNLIPTHPDRLGGLGFLTNIIYAFSLLAMAHGALLAALIANRVFFTGARFIDFKYDIVLLLIYLFIILILPLVVFSAQLAACKREGLREYGELAQRYVRAYDQKWLRGGASKQEQFIGSGDIQSLADLGNGFEVIANMRFLPVSKQTLMQLAGWTLLPILPVLLTTIPLDDLLKRLFSLIF